MKEDDNDKGYEIANKSLDILNDHLSKEHKLVRWAIVSIALCVCFFYLCYFVSGVKTTKDCVETIQRAMEMQEVVEE